MSAVADAVGSQYLSGSFFETAPVPTREGGLKVLIISSHPAGEQAYCYQLIQGAKE